MARFGKYDVLGVLGRGGMAEVLKCERTGIGGFRKPFAIKRVLPARVSDPRFVEMLLDEARIAAQLSHPNIVQVHEIDELDGSPYVVMEFVDGPTLNQLLQRARERGSWEVPHFLRIVSSVCLGLDHAHRATGADGAPLNVVHRDVSPQNIIVSREGTPKLLDFGIARASDRLSETGVGVLKGKVAYMAPEQARGEGVGPAADVFAMGCVLFQCVTGRHPFPGPNAAAVLRAVTSGEHRHASEVAPTLCPRELGDIIETALVADPAKRCPSARALHVLLESYLSQAGYPSGTGGVARWLRELYPSADPIAALEPYTGDAGTAVARPRPRAQSASGTSAPGIAQRGEASRAPEGEPVTYTVVQHKSPLFWVFTGLVSLAVVAAIVVFLVAPERFGVGTEPAPAAAVTVDAPEPSAPRDTAVETLTTYLDEIEALTAQRKYAVALDLLAKARGLEVHDAPLAIRLAKVGDATEIASYVSLARTALDAGERDDAIAHAKAALDRDFDNAEARAILAEARALGAAEAPAAPPTAAVGAMTVSGTEGAAVVVDDEPVGRVPLALPSLAAGEHRVEVRLAGYRTERRTVRVDAGGTLEETFALVREAPTRSAAALRAAVARRERAATPTIEARGGDAGPAETAPADAAPTEPAPTEAVEAEPEAEVAAAPAEPSRAEAKATAPATKTDEAAPPAAVERPDEATTPSAPKPPVSAPPSAALAPVAAPALPATASIQSARDVVAIFQRVERQAVERGGVPAAGVTNCTAPLAKRLVDGFSPGQPLRVYPAGMYFKIVRMARAGRSREAIAGALLRGHLSGGLQSYH